MTQIVTAKDTKDVVEGVIGAASTVVMDGTGGLLAGDADLKSIVDIKSSKEVFKINLKFLQ